MKVKIQSLVSYKHTWLCLETFLYNDFSEFFHPQNLKIVNWSYSLYNFYYEER